LDIVYQLGLKKLECSLINKFPRFKMIWSSWQNFISSYEKVARLRQEMFLTRLKNIRDVIYGVNFCTDDMLSRFCRWTMSTGHILKNIFKHQKTPQSWSILIFAIFVTHYIRWHQSINWNSIEILMKLLLKLNP